jgi:glutamine synthetase
MSESSKKKYPEFVSYHFLNASGELMAMEEDGQHTETFLREGLHVDGSSIKGMSSVENSDLRVMPEEDSFQTIHMKDFVHHRFLCHLLDDNGNPHPRDPRGILMKLVDKAHSMGFEPYMFSEVEFYIVNEQDGTPIDTAGYCSLPPKDKSYTFRQDLGKLCKTLGMQVKRIHHECGPGQNEIELNLTPCMKNADDTISLIWILEILAAKRNQKILFSPKPLPGQAGNGLHHHIMFRDLKTGANVFANTEFNGAGDPTDTTQSTRLSTLCKQGIAGLLKYADDITAVFAASTETFDRLVPGFEAPIFKAWGYSNRTALVRVPKSDLNLTRFEYRGGDLSGSVHLFGAVLLGAVLKGIEEQLEAPPNVDFNLENLSIEELARRHNIGSVPLTLEKCIEVMRKSEFLKEYSLGPEMVEYLIQRNQELLEQVPPPVLDQHHQ